MTAGVAILDLSGQILSVNSFKEVSRAEITKHIITFGKTVLVATDVHQPPRLVKKMATSLNSKIYAPYRDLAVSAKNEMVDNYIHSSDDHPLTRRTRDIEPDLIPQNAHERDALAAAIQGYKKYQKKLEHIKKKALNLGIPSEMVDEVKIMVINEVPITKAINATLEKLKHPVKLHTSENMEIKSSKIPLKEDIPNSDRVSGTFKEDSKIEDTTELISGLKNRLKSQEKQIKKLQKKNSIINDDLERYQDEISQLETKIEKLHYQYSQNMMEPMSRMLQTSA